MTDFQRYSSVALVGSQLVLPPLPLGRVLNIDLNANHRLTRTTRFHEPAAICRRHSCLNVCNARGRKIDIILAIDKRF